MDSKILGPIPALLDEREWAPFALFATTDPPDARIGRRRGSLGDTNCKFVIRLGAEGIIDCRESESTSHV